ncbi:MAG: hypothetical protein ACLUD0_07105 [Eubacterium ramulus]
MPIPETPCAITVAPAAPPTPSRSPIGKNHRSSTIFKMLETARKSGAGDGIADCPQDKSAK